MGRFQFLHPMKGADRVEQPEQRVSAGAIDGRTTMNLGKRIERLEQLAGDGGQRTIVIDVDAETGAARYYVNSVEQPHEPEQRPGDVVIRFIGNVSWDAI